MLTTFNMKELYGVLLVNPRDSTGFGERNSRSLLGMVDMYVKDYHIASELGLLKHLYLPVQGGVLCWETPV